MSGAMQRFLASPPIHFLGRVSFAFYLCHGIMIQSLGAMVFVGLGQHAGCPLGWAVVFAYITGLASTCAVAFLVTKFVDEPIAIRGVKRVQEYITAKLCWSSRDAAVQQQLLHTCVEEEGGMVPAGRCGQHEMAQLS